MDVDINYKLIQQLYLNFDIYMLLQYHGGTNFGRVASEFVTTSYYNLAPLDEYGTHTPLLTCYIFSIIKFWTESIVHIIRLDQSTNMEPFEGFAYFNQAMFKYFTFGNADAFFSGSKTGSKNN